MNILGGQAHSYRMTELTGNIPSVNFFGVLISRTSLWERDNSVISGADFPVQWMQMQLNWTGSLGLGHPEVASLTRCCHRFTCTFQANTFKRHCRSVSAPVLADRTDSAPQTDPKWSSECHFAAVKEHRKKRKTAIGMEREEKILHLEETSFYSSYDNNTIAAAAQIYSSYANVYPPPT